MACLFCSTSAADSRVDRHDRRDPEPDDHDRHDQQGDLERQAGPNIVPAL